MAATTEKPAVFTFSEDALFRAIEEANPYAADTGRAGVPRYLARYLADVGARTVVVERDYVDGDYLEDHASYYVRCFRDYPRHCTRLHFFRSEFASSTFDALVTRSLDKDQHEEICRSYLGFVVVRPIPNAIIGRTLLQTYEDDNGRRHYTVKRRYTANLFGQELTIHSLPFQEQDEVLAACATVALWSAFHKTAELFGTPAPRPAEITRSANGAGNSSRAIPTHGLDLRQMAHAIRCVGLEPELIEVGSGVPLASAACAYLDLGLPVVLGVDIEETGLHAVTLVGYSRLRERVRAFEVSGTDRAPPLGGLHVNEFYAHDDGVGPFARLVVDTNTDSGPLNLRGGWRSSKDGRELLMSVKCLLIPVYNKIRVPYVDVLRVVERLWRAAQLVTEKREGLEWNISLASSNQLKRDVAMKLQSHPELREDRRQFLLSTHPRFCWVATLLDVEGPVADFICDATDTARSQPIYRVTWHNSSFASAMAALLDSVDLSELLARLLSPALLRFLKTDLSLVRK